MPGLIKKAERPSLFWLVTEPCRAVAEISFSYSYKRFFKEKPNGDGHPVMVLPGFMGTDRSTSTLRKYLDDMGYDVYDWGLGRNIGNVHALPVLLERLAAIHEDAGEPVSLVGWSLGGVYARQLAKAKPHIVRQVITMGSPFKNLTRPNNVEWIYTMISGGKKATDTHQEILSNLPLPAPVPTTAIYSKEDGIVHWETCMEDEDDTHQNIQVRGSHFGLVANTAVLAIIADRLRYDKSNWLPFKPKGALDGLLFYPSL